MVVGLPGISPHDVEPTGLTSSSPSTEDHPHVRDQLGQQQPLQQDHMHYDQLRQQQPQIALQSNHDLHQGPFHSQMNALPVASTPSLPFAANSFDMTALTTNLPGNAFHLPHDTMQGRSSYHYSSSAQGTSHQPYSMIPQEPLNHNVYGRAGPQFAPNMPQSFNHPSQDHVPQALPYSGPATHVGRSSHQHATLPISLSAAGGYIPMHPPYAVGQYAAMDYGSSSGHNATMPSAGAQSTYALLSTDISSAVPAYPRGPPRKPKQSGHAIWVGNLPPSATVVDLKDHFSRDATDDIESLFLIAKSNCAFVNYRSEAACIAAMNRFHDSRFHGVRLVCRLRRSNTDQNPSPASTSASTSANIAAEEKLLVPGDMASSGKETATREASPPLIVGHRTNLVEIDPGGQGANLQGNDNVVEKYFIVKSLTIQDLEASVKKGTWATQSHNEDVLNRAFEQADSVYLIFSANKSGQYFGYARMMSAISGQPIILDSEISNNELRMAGTPQSIMTPATGTAPRGRIIDDSSRGTIFWEVDQSDEEDHPDAQSGHGSAALTESQRWGRQFDIQWLSTTRLPFFRTRGLRNPWNANREVKIARDGTELEPTIGRQLVKMFHRLPQPVGVNPGTASTSQGTQGSAAAS